MKKHIFILLTISSVFSSVLFLAPKVFTPFSPDPSIHIFYYTWYRTPLTDGSWQHWNNNNHRPPTDIASLYYPLPGPYSSRDPLVIQNHLEWIASAHIGTIILSFWGKRTDVELLDELAYWSRRYRIFWSVLLEPYTNRLSIMRQDLEWLYTRYADRFLHVSRPTWVFHDDIPRPIVYIFKLSSFSPARWTQWFKELHARPPYWCILLNDITGTNITWGADGLYSYTPAPHNLNPQYYPGLADKLSRMNALFIPMVSPGFEPRDLAPERAYLYSPRFSGRRYDRDWEMAINLAKDWIGIISFNEWHEGTQIEPARSMQGYLDYENHFNKHGWRASWAYLERTQFWAEKWASVRTKDE